MLEISEYLRTWRRAAMKRESVRGLQLVGQREGEQGEGGEGGETAHAFVGSFATIISQPFAGNAVKFWS